MPNRITLVAAVAVAALSGCAMTGLSEADGSFACKAPAGVSCKSVSGVYANAQQGNLPGLRANGSESTRAAAPEREADASQQYARSALPVAVPGVALRSQAKTIRIWIAPWVDADGDMHDQSYVYLVANPGNWMVEQSREATVTRALTRLRPPSGVSAQPAQSQVLQRPSHQMQRSAQELANESAALGEK